MTFSIRGLARVFFVALLPLTLFGALVDHFFVSHAPLPAAILRSALLLAAGFAASYVLYELVPKLFRSAIRWLERE